jgi:hypothetical protein
LANGFLAAAVVTMDIDDGLAVLVLVVKGVGMGFTERAFPAF